MNKLNLRHGVFWPPFILLLIAGLLSLLYPEWFLDKVNIANNWLLENVGWLFSLGGLAMLAAVVIVFFSPLGKYKIGGEHARPMLKMKSWLAITLCTTIAAGVTFWGIVEPIYHMVYPPESSGIEANSPDAIMFSMSTMYLHWTVTPYAIYCVPALMFAFAFYNMRKPFSLSSTLTPLLGNRMEGKLSSFIDAISLYTLSLGMASAMGTAVLNMAGGVNYLTGIESNATLWAIIAAITMIVFTISASTGLMNGIRILSDINTKAYIIIIIFIFITGPIAFIVNLGTESFGFYLTHFFEKSLFTGASGGDAWPKAWTVFYWANWFAWAAITAMFLGRISYGYSVRTFIIVNFVVPSVFGGLWMTIFGGTSIYKQITDNTLGTILGEQGAESVLYAVLADVPLSAIVIPVYLFIVFISFVTASDSNISAMGGISTKGITADSQESHIGIKIAWGASVGIIAWVMLSFAKIDGIKILSNLGGIPALILCLAIIFALLKVAFNPAKYDITASLTKEEIERTNTQYSDEAK
ncbi:BCCT family transporter [Lysinibacillus macroides]|uniref:BCCT transporter n=1 Tax=Lysinibacillus macroides TaxID=33935 RepID=A0A0M9DMU4_9BACI|nr:BCCT family transporter [Lysinibacillus macroides]KOY83843.1 BCCT transporter [Lysinibacillus macroides]QPR67118.1 BCCT family transporter [Lysinibacillus macroides]